MSSTAVMPMPMRLPGTVAPASYPERASWRPQAAVVSAGFGLGLGSSFVCVTTNDHQIKATNTKAHGNRRLQETST